MALSAICKKNVLKSMWLPTSKWFSVTSFRTFLKTPYLYYTGGQYRWAGRN